MGSYQKGVEAMKKFCEVCGGTKRKWGFLSKRQLPLFMIWEEDWFDGDVVYARIIFNSMDWIGI